MWEIFQSIGSIDRLKSKGSLKNYKKKLQEYKENEADLLIDMAMLCFDDEKYDESLQYLKEARYEYFKLKNREGEAYIYDLIGDIYLSIREMDKALTNYKKSFKIYADIKSSMKSDELEKIKEVEDIKEAIEIANKGSEEVLEEEESTIEEIVSYEDPSVTQEEYVECHLNYEKVAIKLEKVFKLIKKNYNVNEISKEEYETGYIQKSVYDAREEGNDQREMSLFLLTGYYLMSEQKQYSALKSFKEAFNIARELEDNKGKGFSLLLLGSVYYILGSKDKIYDVFKKSLEIFRNSGYKEEEAAAIDLINTLYSEDVCTDEKMISSA